MKIKVYILILSILSSCTFYKTDEKSGERKYERKDDLNIVSWNEDFNSDKARQLSKKGVDLGLEGNYEEAEKIFLEALKEEPGNPTILNNIGLTYFKRREYNKAIEYYSKSLKISDSTSLMAVMNLGLTYYHQMDYNRALEILKFGIENSESDKTAEFVLRLHRLMVNIELKNCSEIKNDRKEIENLRYKNQVGDYKSRINQFDEKISKLCSSKN